MSSSPVPRPTRSRTATGVGLVLATLLAVGQLSTYVPMFAEELVLPAVFTALNVASLVAVPFVWRGAGWARVVVVVATVTSALSGLPAFFIAGIPVAGVIAAAVGILLSLVVTVLLVVGAGRPASRAAGRAGAFAAVVAGLVLAAPSAPAASAAPVATGHSCGVVVRVAPIGSEDTWSPCTLLEGHRGASADTFEHYAELCG